MNSIQENVIFNAETDEFNKSLVDLRKELRHLRGVMTEVEQGTDEYNEALKRAADINTHITYLNREVKNSYVNLETGLGNIGKAAGSVTRSMNALKGITNMVAGENSKASESIEKMMSMMALTSGLSGIGGMIRNLKNLGYQLKSSTVVTKGLTAVQRVYNAVLSANPIFIILAVIMAVVGGIILLTKVLKTNNDANERMNKLLEEQEKSMEDLTEVQSFNIEMMKALGKTQEEIIQQEIEDAKVRKQLAEEQRKQLEDRLENEKGLSKKMKKELTQRIADLQEASDEEVKVIEDKNKALVLENERTQKKIQEDADKVLELIRQNNLTDEGREKDALKRRYEEQKEMLEKAGIDTTKLTQQYNQQLADINKKYRDAEQAERDAKQAIQDAKDKKEEERLQGLQDVITEHQEERRRNALSAQDLELEDLGNHYDVLIANAKELGEGYEDVVLELEREKEARLQEVKDAYDKIEKEKEDSELEKLRQSLMTKEEIEAERKQKELDELEAHYQRLVELAGDNDEELLKLQEAYNAKKKELNEEEVDDEADKTQILSDMQFALADAVSGALNAVANLMEESNKDGKALAGASIIIDTLMGIMGIWSGVKGVTGSILAGIQSVALAATGAANFKKVMAVNPKGETGGGAGKIAQPKMNIPNAPSFDNSINFIRQAQTEEEIDMQGQPVKAYVVETELRDVSKRVDQTESESSF